MAKVKPHKRIQCICEGSSDEAFFVALCRDRQLNGIEVRKWPDEKPQITRGITGFRRLLSGMLVETDIEHCKLVILVADNDGSPAGRFAEIVDEIKKAGGYGVPAKPRQVVTAENANGRTIPDLVVLMLPWDDIEGNLESLLYQAGKSHNKALSQCIESFTQCATSGHEAEWDVAKTAKLKARLLLSASAVKNPDVPIARAWGSDNGDPFPLKSQTFKKVADYLATLNNQYSTR